MRESLGILTLSLLLLSCQNKSRQKYSPMLIDTQNDESYQQPDTVMIEDVRGKM